MHRTPDGIIQNYLDTNENIDYAYDASVKLMWAQTDYYEAMTSLVKEQTTTEQLRQKLLRKRLESDNINDYDDD